ncbi:MAG: hypothetical protein ABSF26_06100 [Thermoguttaceae bacterium]|jgi:hypothetical protein
MSIWNKILLWFIGVAAAVCFYTSARTLKTYQHWCTKAIDFQTKLEALQKTNQDLLEADKDRPLADGSMGVRALKAELTLLLLNRGRIWDKCDLQKVDPRTGDVALNTDAGTPNRISVNTILYAFEDWDDKSPGQYVGEFKATAVADNKVQLAPTLNLTERDLKRLAGSKGPWSMYELMPVDRHTALASLSEEEKKARLPAESVAEYLKDGQPAAADDPPQRKEEGKYRRSLRDYKELFRASHSERTLFVDRFEALTRDVKYLADSKTDSLEQTQFAQRELGSVQTELALARKEQKEVADHMAVLEHLLQGLQQIVAERIRGNLAIAREIAKVQLDAARLIDERTRTMAQFGPGK